jgi:predicted kinase
MKQVIIVRGPPGSGKTTLVKNEYPDAVICSADGYFDEVAAMNGTTYLKEFKPWLMGKAHQHCWGAYIHALCVMDEETIIVDNTNIHKWEYENYVLLAEVNGYNVEIVEIPFTESAEVYHERNTHGVPLEVIERMMNDYEH